MKINKKVLLLGAGFTKNFRGRLANEMWTDIFNDGAIRKRKRVQELMRNKLDYEAVYHALESPAGKKEYSNGDREAYRLALERAYELLDLRIKEIPKLKQTRKILTQVNNSFINLYFDKECDLNFVFTLNQDLLFERFYDSKPPLFIPFIPFPGNEGEEGAPEFELNNLPWDFKEFPIVLPSAGKLKEMGINFEGEKVDIKLDKIQTSFNLIKLHGSYNFYSWEDEGKEKKKRKMVIGFEKEPDIKKEPLLMVYYELFKRVLSQGDVKLLTVGYGFGDSHINRIIAENMEPNNLTVFIQNPRPVDEFLESVWAQKDKNGKFIWDRIKGYFPYTTTDLFPDGKTHTIEWADMQEKIFGIPMGR